MIKIAKIGPITHNCDIVIKEIRGEILKIVVFSKRHAPNIMVELKSIDGETIIKDYLNDDKTRFYPKNVIKVTQEQSFIENYFVAGKMFLYVSGMGDNEAIDRIVVYYKDLSQ